MSQLTLNQTIQSRVTDPESGQKKGIFKNSENHLKKRPCSALPSKAGNDDDASIGTVGDFTRTRKLGYLPSYLKKQTKSSVESELVTKHKKFKVAKRELIDKQTHLMNDFKQLQSLKDKFRQLGGRDFKLEIFKLVDFSDYGIENNACGDGVQNTGIGDCVSNGQMLEFQREIQRIRGRVKDCLFKLIELNADALKHIQTSGTEALQVKIQDIFSKVEDYVKSVNHEQDTSMQFLVEKLQQIKSPMPDEVKPSKNYIFQEEEIVRLQKAVQNLEVESKILQSEIDMRNQEIEYLKNKEFVHSKSLMEPIDNDEQECLRSEIESQKELLESYRNKLNQRLQLQESLETKISQLENTVGQQNHQMEQSLFKFENDLCDERKKCKELEEMLEEVNRAKITQKSGSSFDLISNQLASANEEVKELQFKLSKRDKQIQNLKQIVSAESNKTKDYDQLLLRYDELLLQDQCKSNEMHRLKEKVIARTDTINSQILIISDLKRKLRDQVAGMEYVGNAGPLQDDQTTKLMEHERIIKKLENNKIRSNRLRDQLLERISMLEKENDDMKGQIRKFHEDFTINRFMYDEQRRKKRLTEILVKQYQK